jgi:hypothetical protein
MQNFKNVLLGYYNHTPKIELMKREIQGHKDMMEKGSDKGGLSTGEGGPVRTKSETPKTLKECCLLAKKVGVRDPKQQPLFFWPRDLGTLACNK